MPLLAVIARWAGGPIWVALAVLATLMLVWGNTKAMRRRPALARGYWLVNAWVLFVWVLTALWAIVHLYPKGTPANTVLGWFSTTIGVVWVVLGAWKVFPFVVRGSRNKPP